MYCPTRVGCRATRHPAVTLPAKLALMGDGFVPKV